MGHWNFYFIAKLFLYFGRYISFDVLANGAFAAFLLIPIRNARLRLARHIAAAPVAVALLYHDSWLPPISRVFSQADQLQGFALGYQMELLGRFISPMVLVNLLILFGVYFFVQRKFSRVTPVVLVAMLLPLLPIVPAPAGPDRSLAGETSSPAQDASPAETGARATTEAAAPAADPGAADATKDAAAAPARDAAKTAARAAPAQDSASKPSGPPTDARLAETLGAFYRREAARKVSFPAQAGADAPFDILLLQICSLSWDDLDFTKERDNAMLRKFDIVFTQFNTAASYSGPAVIRALRSSCGQAEQKSLYETADRSCLTLDNLERTGYQPQLALNHDGRYGNFLTDVRERGGLKVEPFDARAVPAYLKSFDGSPIQDDFEVLSRWWAQRLKNPAPRVALFYNSVTLHDGNRYADNRPGNSMEIFKPRLTRLLAGMDRLFGELQKSGRQVVVVFISEHGASVRGDRMQIAGLREIPSPRITLAPVGIKLIGAAAAPAPVRVSKPTSYLAVSQLLANFVRTSPFGKDAPALETQVRDLPSTDFTAENDETVVMRYGAQYFIRTKSRAWIEYDPSE